MTDSSPEILKINEIFYSIQGESTYAGRPCVFIRLTYCNLRCNYCDTQYAFFEGKDRSLDDILEAVKSYNCNLVEITGGEPLIQKNVHILMSRLCNSGYEVLIETAGHMDISNIDKRVKKIMDIKCPSSGESEKILWENIDHLSEYDEVKFVIGNRKDFDWASQVLQKYQMDKKCTILFSPVFGKINYTELAGWILKEKLPVQMQLQIHKFIWPTGMRGV